MRQTFYTSFNFILKTHKIYSLNKIINYIKLKNYIKPLHYLSKFSQIMSVDHIKVVKIKLGTLT